MDVSKATAEPKGLAHQTIWLATAKGISLALTLFLPLVLVRRLSQTEFGLYKQAFQILSTTLSLLCLQVSASAYYFMPREPKRKPQIALNVLVFYLSIGSLVALFFAVDPRWITLIFSSDDLVPVMPLLGLAILLWLLPVNLEGVMIANGDIRWSSVVIVCAQLLKSALLIGAGIAFGTIRAIIIAAVILGAAHSGIFLVYLRRRFGRFWQTFDWPLFKAQLSNALPFGIGSIAYIIQYDLHNYYVSHYFSPAEFAIYSVGCFQLPLLLVLFDSVDTVLLPEITRLEKDGAHQRIIQVWIGSMRMLAFVSFPICAFLFVMRHEFIVTLFTKAYAASTPIFAINLGNLLLSICLTGTVLRAFPEFRFFRFKFYLFLLPMTWGALHFGIRLGGLRGAITAVALTRLLDVGVTMVMLGRRLGMALRDLRHFEPLARLAGAAAMAALVAYVAKFALAARPAPFLLASCAAMFGLTYLISAFVVGGVTATEQAQLRSLWARFYRFRAIRAGFSSGD